MLVTVPRSVSQRVVGGGSSGIDAAVHRQLAQELHHTFVSTTCGDPKPCIQLLAVHTRLTPDNVFHVVVAGADGAR